MAVPAGPQSQQRDVVLPIIARAPQIADDPLYMHDFLQQPIVDAIVNPDPVVEGEGSVECESLKIAVWINVNLAALTIHKKFFDAGIAFEVDDGHVGLHSRPIEGRGCSLTSNLAGFVPWRSTYRVALGGGHNGVERVQSRAGDQSRLIVDPEMLDRVKGIGKDNSLL